MIEPVSNLDQARQSTYLSMHKDKEVKLDTNSLITDFIKENQIKKINESSKKVDSESVKDFESKLNDFLKEENLTLEFKKDDDTQKMVMKLIDNETDEIIKQFPPEISLQIAKMVSSLLNNNITSAKV
ncbi:flagellar protein FlaG [Candidatus Kapabacteria bacterium]|nr:flagellar protein FlaG [Candidatus Kapabacteria bacterium]